MKLRPLIIALLTSRAAFSLGAPPQGVDLAALDGWDIVIAKDAIPSELYAAEEFQTHVEGATGHRLPMVNSHAADRPDRHIFIGPGPALKASPVAIELGKFGPEDLSIVIRDGNIAIAGGRPRGTLYGVYTFLEDYLGVRFLTHDQTHIPGVGKRTIAGPVDRFYHPPVGSRYSGYGESVQYPTWAVRQRNNYTNYLHAYDKKYGGRSKRILINHTFANQIPSSKYGKEHPEYYALRDGKRLAPFAQDAWSTEPCLTNPDVLRIVTAAILKELKENPEQTNVAVGQNDNNNHCQCPSCAAIDEREGTPMGSLLTFVNAVADEVAKTHPKVKVGTLSYQYSRTPPKTLRPRPNVQIQLCSIECCQIHPIDDPDCPNNVAFCEDLADWGKICDDVSIWSYNTNFANYLLPCPNLRTIGPNIRFFAGSNAKAINMQGAWNSGGAEFSDLRNYMVSGMLWDPSRSARVLMDEFLDLYYGRAAPPIRRFIDFVHDTVESKKIHPDHSGDAEEYGIDAAIAQAGIEAFAEAMTLAENDTFKARIGKASICAYRAAIEPIWIQEGSHAFTPESEELWPLLQEFIQLGARHNIGMFNEGTFFRHVRPRLEQLLPDPPLAEGLPGVDVTRIDIVGFPQPWRFRIDPGNEGVKGKWFEPDLDDGAWATIRTDRFEGWDTQGYGGAKAVGYGWYRAKLAGTAEQWAKPNLYLYFDAVDEEAFIYLNGQLAFENTLASTGLPGNVLWSTPFSGPLKNVRPKGPNQLTIRVHNIAYMGGIYRPLYLIASHVPLTHQQIMYLMQNKRKPQ